VNRCCKKHSTNCTSSRPVDWTRFVKLISGNERFLVTTHIRPDCDGLGSAIAMAQALEHLNKEVVVVTGFETPPNLAFLDPDKRIKRIGTDIQIEQLQSIDAVVVLDTSAWAQLGDMCDFIRTTKAIKIVLDHHVNEDEIGAEVFKNSEAAATGRLVVEAMDHLNVTITPDIATPLFAAIATDSGWFRFKSTSETTYLTAARLVKVGAEPDKIYQMLYEKETLARLRLTGRVLDRAKTDLDGRLIYTWIELGDFEETGAMASDTEDLINLTLKVDGVDAAFILVEQATGGFKISFRSRCKLDCCQLAKKFGGGGHKAAAGAMIHQPLAVARATLLESLKAEMQ